MAAPEATPQTPPGPRRPADWVAPGPVPACNPIELGPLEQLAYLSGDFRIVQRRDGHTWSLDDLIVAWLAQAVAAVGSRCAAFANATDPAPRRILDLGTGIGSVLFMLAWRFPEAHLTGIEAQTLSHALSLRTAHYNGVEARVNLIHNDFRGAVPELLARDATDAAAFDLVTGTPPYFDDREQPRSTHVQRGPCRFEDRGGIDAYLTAMAALLARGPDHARAVVCHASRQRERVLAAIAASGMVITRALAVVPKVGKEPLVDAFALARAPTHGAAPPTFDAATFETLTVRDAADQWTPAFRAVRTALGMPDRAPARR